MFWRYHPGLPQIVLVDENCPLRLILQVVDKVVKSAMPLNTLRLNYQPSSHPNERIVFIKPIPRPASQKGDYDRAELILKAIAAQCLPIMKDHYLSVTTLEEYEPNPEFIGRNFNNGEVIQLVLQSRSGAWMPLNSVQMVMMHELAHNTHMNHGKGFWQARNLYANEMRQLWNKGYTGEGLWGRGRTLEALENEIGGNFVASEEIADLPLCGGTFRSRRKKRKAKDSSDLTWKEKRDKRIEKKFGKNGNALGADEDKRFLLSMNGKAKGSIGSAPRVAQSKRGRELRAAAALARFDTNKKEVTDIEAATKEEDTETESEYEEVDMKEEDARDRNGKKLSDGKGQPVIRVCEEEDIDDVNVKNELAELADLNNIQRAVNKYADDSDATLSADESEKHPNTAIGNSFIRPEAEPVQNATTTPTKVGSSDDKPSAISTETQENPFDVAQPTTSEVPCGVCSMTNNALQLTCIACAHVLDARKDSRHWKCTSDTCKDGIYINAGDCGVCGVCGARKPVNSDVQSRMQ